MTEPLRLCIPDLVSPSYFPAAVMVESGFAAEQGLDMVIDQIWPVDLAVEELHTGALDLLAAPAHIVPRPGSGVWGSPRIVAAISQGTFWFLVARADLNVDPSDLSTLAGLHVAAAPGPDLAFAMLLHDAGVDAEALNIKVGLPEGIPRPRDMSFGAWAAGQLNAGRIDAFWANGMGAELAVRSGAARVVLDVRRGDGPAEAFHYTFASIVASGRTVEERPDAVRAIARALAATHCALRDDPTVAQSAADRLFPAVEASLAVELVRRDTKFYDATVDAAAVEGVARFLRALGSIDGHVTRAEVVADP